MICIAWAAPAILFWGLKMGNSPRHAMAASAALLLLPGIVAADLLPDWRALAAATAALVLANYYSRPPNGQTLQPSPRLVASAGRLQFRVGVLHRRSREFASLDAPASSSSATPPTPTSCSKPLPPRESTRSAGTTSRST